MLTHQSRRSPALRTPGFKSIQRGVQGGGPRLWEDAGATFSANRAGCLNVWAFSYFQKSPDEADSRGKVILGRGNSQAYSAKEKPRRVRAEALQRKRGAADPRQGHSTDCGDRVLFLAPATCTSWCRPRNRPRRHAVSHPADRYISL